MTNYKPPSHYDRITIDGITTIVNGTHEVDASTILDKKFKKLYYSFNLVATTKSLFDNDDNLVFNLNKPTYNFTILGIRIYHDGTSIGTVLVGIGNTLNVITTNLKTCEIPLSATESIQEHRFTALLDKNYLTCSTTGTNVRYIEIFGIQHLA